MTKKFRVRWLQGQLSNSVTLSRTQGSLSLCSSSLSLSRKKHNSFHVSLTRRRNLSQELLGRLCLTPNKLRLSYMSML